MMPPRTRGAGSSYGERRRTRQLMNVSDDERLDFSTSDAIEKYRDNILRRKLIIGKVILPSFCSRQRLHTYALFDAVGWGPFVSLQRPQYPTLVRIFYTRLEFVSHHQLLSYVRNTRILLSYHEFGQILGVDDGEFGIYIVRGWPEFDGFDPVMGLRQLCGDPTINEPFKLYSNQLTVESRLIHNIVRTNIIPRAGGTNFVSTMQIFIIWCILNGKKLSLPYIMFHHMKHVVGRNKGGLPYPIALTKLFQHFKIPLKGETDTRALVKTDYYTTRTLKLMGLTNTNFGWVDGDRGIMDEDSENDDNDDVDGDDDEGDEEADQVEEDQVDRNAAQEDSVGTSVMLDQILKGMSTISNSMQELRIEFKMMNEKLSSMQADIASIKRSHYN